METGTQPREVAERYIAAANAHDVKRMLDLWEPGGVETFPTFGQTHRVPDQFASHFECLFEAIPDVSWDIISITADSDGAVVRSRMSGIHLGNYQGIAGTGQRFAVETIDFLQIRAGKIAHNDVVFDGLDVLRQLGVLPPQNSRRERAMQALFNAMTRLRRRRLT